jgi:sec-independent protein translocase protein TatA
MNFSPVEIGMILLVVVLIFGANKIPQLGKGIGEGIRNFKSAFKEIQKDPEEKPATKPKEEKQ